MMHTTESILCETIDAAILLRSSVGDMAESQSALFGVPSEHLFFDFGDLEPNSAFSDERATDAWTALRLEAHEH